MNICSEGSAGGGGEVMMSSRNVCCTPTSAWGMRRSP